MRGGYMIDSEVGTGMEVRETEWRWVENLGRRHGEPVGFYRFGTSFQRVSEDCSDNLLDARQIS